jgi:branched-chain amino acid transport system substrate-binding protein
MRLTRRAALAAASSTAILPSLRARAQAKPVIRIGVTNDQSGPYRDVNGPTSVACVKQAVQEFAAGAFDVEVFSADNQNKPDIAVSIGRQWIDEKGVDVIMDCAATSAALALSSLCKEKNKVCIPSATASSDLTGKGCSPNTIHWAFDTYMESKSTGGALVKAGGTTWYMLNPNYAFGEALRRDASKIVEAAGGKVVGGEAYPFPETTDFSAQLVKAQASGAKVLGFCGAGSDVVNVVKQASEFGLTKTMSIAALVCYTQDVRSIGLQGAQGMTLSETYYWDLNDRTRAFQKRIQPKVTLWPSMAQAGCYSATLHYLKAVSALGADVAKKDGLAVVNKMKAMPTDDDCFGKGRIREDGRKIHPAYLFKVKAPSESKGEWDLYKLIGTTPAEEAFRPMAEDGCYFIKS